MNAKHWKIADLPWAQFDPALVDAEILKIVKAAALVEYNALSKKDPRTPTISPGRTILTI